MLANRRKFWLCFFLVGSVAVLATTYGDYECGECSPFYHGAYEHPDWNTRNFISSTVNQDVSQWRRGDTVRITNPDGGETIVEWAGSAFIVTFVEYAGSNGGCDEADCDVE
jgi:hypothetical protein